MDLRQLWMDSLSDKDLINVIKDVYDEIVCCPLGDGGMHFKVTIDNLLVMCTFRKTTILIFTCNLNTDEVYDFPVFDHCADAIPVLKSLLKVL